MERSTWAWMLAGSLLLSWIGFASCAAQSPGPPSPSPSPPSVVPAEPDRRGWPAPPPLRGPVAPEPPEGLLPAGTSPLDTGVKLPMPTPMANEVRFPINLATALRLSDARPLIVAAAQASVWVAEADLTQAKVLWLPDPQPRLRLYPSRRRRPGLQQGHLDRGQHELLLRRRRPDGARPWGSSPRPMPFISPWSHGRSSTPGTGTSSRRRTTPCSNRRRLLPGAPATGAVRRDALLRPAGARAGRSDRHSEPRPGPGGRSRASPEHAG